MPPKTRAESLAGITNLQESAKTPKLQEKMEIPENTIRKSADSRKKEKI